MNQKTLNLIPALLGFLAVALGAFGAHGLKETLTNNGTLDVWEKAVFYHFIHAVMMALLARQSNINKPAWIGFFIGVLLFSGSLYLYSVTQIPIFAHITPFGGVALLVGWFFLAREAWKLPGDHSPQ